MIRCNNSQTKPSTCELKTVFARTVLEVHENSNWLFDKSYDFEKQSFQQQSFKIIDFSAYIPRVQEIIQIENFGSQLSMQAI